jgi:hypothetical protein
MRITLKRRALLYSAAGALFLAGTLQAGLVSAVNSSGQFVDLNQDFGCSNAGTTTASCDVSAFGVGTFDDASGSYQANAQYGSLDTTSMSHVYDTTNGGPGILAGTSSASFSDTFLLTGGIGSGTLVFVTEYGGYGQGESCDTGACLLNSTVALNTFSFHPNGNFYLPINLSFSFSFGTPFNLNGSVSAHSSAEGDETATQTAHLKIDAIEVLDSNGALTGNYSVTSGSGADYPFVTPEPGTLALVTAALLALPLIRRKSISACRRG